MANDDYELYLAEINILKNMFASGQIDEADFSKAEKHLAKKYCIKDKSIYRLNKLINQEDYGINIVTRKETKNEQNNDHKTVVKIV